MKAKSQFIVWLEAPTHASVQQTPGTFLINSELGQERVTVQTRWRTELGKQVIDAIELEVGLEADDVDSAVVLAGTRANRWLAALAFAARASVGDARPLLVYDVTPGARERAFIQHFYQDPWPRPVIVLVDGSDVQEVVNGWGVHQERAHWEVSRAFYWYRRALREQHPNDRFTCLWLGLEALETLLRTRMRVSVDKARCSACNRLLQDPSSAGVKAFLRATPQGEQTYRLARRLRLNLLHTVPHDAETGGDPRALNTELEQALRSAIEQAVGVALPGRPFPPASDLLCAVRGTFRGVEDAKAGGPHPHFRLDLVPTEEEPSTRGFPRFDARLVAEGNFEFEIEGWLVPSGSQIVSRGEVVANET